MDKTGNEFQIFIQKAYDERLRKNSRFSVRSFAKFIGVSPSYLHDLLNGKAVPSRAIMRKICKKLGIENSAQEQLCDSVEAAHSSIVWRRRAAAERISLAKSNLEIDVYNFSDDEAVFISDMIHMWILTTLEVLGGDSKLEEIARSIGRDETDVAFAVERLERVGAVECLDDGDIQLVKSRTRIGDGVAPKSIIDFHWQFSNFILESLNHHDRSKRQMDAIMMAVHSSQIDEFKEILKDTRKKLVALSQKSTAKDTVLFVNLQMVEGRKTWD